MSTAYNETSASLRQRARSGLGADLRTALVAIGVLLGLAALGEAQVVDQSQLTSDGLRAINTNLTQGQTFTVGRDGFLSAVEVSLNDSAARSAPLSLSIWEGSVRRGYVVIPPEGTSAPPLLDPVDVVGTFVDLSAFAIEVAVGEVLELRLRCLESTFFPSAGVALNDLYAGGSATINGSSSTGDLAFKTFVSDDFPPIQEFDQYQPDGVDRNYGIHSGLSRGQTFTAGRSGRLAGVELALSSSVGSADDLEVVLVDVSDDSELARFAIQPQEVNVGSPEYLSPTATVGYIIDFDGHDVHVSEGQQLELQLHSSAPSGQGFAVRGTLANPYPGGAMTNGSGIGGGGDLAFKTIVLGGTVFDDGFESGAVGRWSEIGF